MPGDLFIAFLKVFKPFVENNPITRFRGISQRIKSIFTAINITTILKKVLEQNCQKLLILFFSTSSLPIIIRGT